MPREPKFLPCLCKLLEERDKALRLHWLDEGNDIDLTFWIPKACVDEEDDRDNEIDYLRYHSRQGGVWLLNIAIWWLRDQEWFDDDIQELIDLQSE